MASNLPIPLPPRTPSPLSDDDRDYDFGLGIEGASGGRKEGLPYQPGTLSPPEAHDFPPVEAMLSPVFSPTFSVSGSPNGSLSTPTTDYGGMSEAQATQGVEDIETPRNPFNFTTQQYSANRGSVGSIGSAGREIGKRRGHKYKHSSISHQIFLEPAPRAPLQLPASLPKPTRAEVQKSLTNDQKTRLAWCFCHFTVAAYVQWSAGSSLAMTALSRLLLFDAAGAVACVMVDVMSNFEIWKRSSLKHPFGLERADVLAGFGLAVFIGFMGLDVLSHGIQHSLENKGNHVPHHAHAHSRVSPGSIDMAALLAILSTLVSALLLRNHARVGKAMRFELIAGWGRVLGNPSHFMTLSCSALLLLLPLFSIQTYTWFDGALSFAIAFAMIAFGVRLGTALASMLLMSYSGAGTTASVKDVISDMELDPAVSAVDEARFWQVHYGLCMANLKLRYRGNPYGDELTRLREKLTSLIRNRLGGAYGSGGQRWEVSIQLTAERD